ncbi:MAG: alanine--tRNA ligase [Armatimonadetes bacterium]|nr:alanine--tRNA ligase [Armatimonadota bacterium]
MFTVRELREKYLSFFQSKQHDRFPSGSLVPYDVTGRLDESLLFNGAGMVQFKPYFRGVAKPTNKRLTTAQKCVRTGDIEEVGDLTHLTFFEMLGNFSFGDYFKKEAIEFSWEFMFDPKWLGLDKARVCCTVFEEDSEAFEVWSKLWTEAGFDASSKVFKLGEETNYWPAGAFSAGPPGPCGPNSEMFFWTPNDEPPPKAPYTREDYLRDEKAGKWLEIWNDVFIQYEWKGHHRDPARPSEGYVKEGLEDLPFQSIDTGMGLERTITVLNGKRSLYENDAFEPILGAITAVSGMKYGTAEVTDRAMRVIADHVRTATFCIADGVLPSNTGRGYVLRRLIRRAVLKGQRTLGIEQPFFHTVAKAVEESLGSFYTELVDRRETIAETLRNEEALFRRTLRDGEARLSEALETSKGKQLSGEFAFRLYDTYGFPLEVTQELAEEAGRTVDVEGYEAAMREAQERSRGAGGMETVYGGVSSEEQFSHLPATKFLGYAQREATAEVLACAVRPSGEVLIALDQTPFYAASGGQISDEGVLQIGNTVHRVLDVQKNHGVFLHVVEGLDENAVGLAGSSVKAVVDTKRRSNIQRNHTATHLLHAALRQVLGKHVAQAGSYVGPGHLRFDFAHGKAMTPDEIAEVERIVNEQTLANTDVNTHVDIPIAEAKARGAMALFGEKYGDKVRMVEIGEFSRELCGGTHVRTTGEIGMFKIMNEASAASGVRRIEAVTGEGAYEWALAEAERLKEAASALKASPKEILHAIEKLHEQNRELKHKIEKLRTEGAGGAANTTQLGPVELAVQRLDGAEPKEITLVADRLAENKPERVSVVASTHEGKVTFVAKVGSEALRHKVHAGNLVRSLATIAGGSGGGRPDFATAGGKLPEKLDEALNEAEKLVREMIGSA